MKQPKKLTMKQKKFLTNKELRLEK
ncbi:DUF6906 family protein [Clostridium perfringens]